MKLPDMFQECCRACWGYRLVGKERGDEDGEIAGASS